MTDSRKRTLAALFDRLAPERARWKQLNRYYYQQLEQLCRARLAPGLRVLELGCGTGELLAALEPAFGLGLDLSGGMLDQAQARYPKLRLVQADAEALPLAGQFDAIVLSDLVGHLDDIQQALFGLRRLCHADTRLLLYGTKAEIRAEVERCISLGRDCPGYFLAVGNHIPPNTPVENAIYYNQVYEELCYR